LLVPVVKNGEVVYDLLKLQDIQQRAREQLARLPSQCKRIRGPDGYKIELSKGLTETIDVLTEKYSQKQAVEVGK
jgi:hypothetical protein